jgi:hypothetical protein
MLLMVDNTDSHSVFDLSEVVYDVTSLLARSPFLHNTGHQELRSFSLDSDCKNGASRVTTTFLLEDL